MSLQRFVLKRALATVPLLFGVSVLTFAMIQFIPGDPVDFITQFADIDQEVENGIREQYGLNDPVYVQYLSWVSDAIVLDFGESITNNRTVAAAITDRLPYTLLMGGMAFLVSIITAIPLGIYAAYYRNTAIDQTSRVGALLGISIPNFFLGLLLILLFASNLGWFDIIPPTEDGALSVAMIKFMILPAIAIGTGSTALLMRLMRSSMVEELDKDYVRTARAKGLRERTVVLKHVVRNSLISVVTVAAIQIAFIISGSVVIETVFSVPGVGRLLVNSVQVRDFPVIQALVLIIGVFVIVANLLADILYAYLDPRIRY